MSDETADTATPAAPATPDKGTPEPTVEEQLAAAQADAEKWKGLSRKHEEKAKGNADAAKRIEELERQNMTELEQAVAKAKDETRAEVAALYGSALAGEAIRAAATGRVADVDAFLEGVNPGKFLDAEGNPDRDAITAWIDRVAPAETAPTPVPVLPAGFYDLGQGARGTAPTVPDPLEAALTELTKR